MRPVSFQNYHVARLRFGLASSSEKGSFHRALPTSTFEWKGNTVEEALQWAVARIDALRMERPGHNRALLALDVFAEAYGLDPADILAPIRDVAFNKPRQLAMCYCGVVCRMSRPAVGRIFKRDHTTVLHASRVFDKLMRDEYAKYLSNGRSTPDGQSSGSLPADVHAEVCGDRDTSQT